MNEFETITVFTYFAAFGGGLVSFLSPCVMPVVPGYLSVITGLDLAELQSQDRARLFPIARDTGLFIAGFGSVFMLIGLASSSLGDLINTNQDTFTRVSGVLVMAMGLFMAGSLYLRAPWMFQEKRFHPDLGRYGRAAPTVAGAAFGFGWTPCIGPVLVSVLAVAAADGRGWAGASLLGVYSLGLGVPFLMTGLLFARLAGALGWVRRNMQGIVLVSSLSLTFFGALLVLNKLNWVTSELTELARALGLDFIVELG